MNELFFMMTHVLFSWLVLFLLFLGIGLSLNRAFGGKIQSSEDFLVSFWAGWGFVICILQIWHLWLRIDWKVFIFISALGTAGLSWNGPLLCTPFPKANLRLRKEGDISKGFLLDSKYQ